MGLPEMHSYTEVRHHLLKACSRNPDEWHLPLVTMTDDMSGAACLKAYLLQGFQLICRHLLL